MNKWPTETAFLVKTGVCMVPLAARLLVAEGMAMRTGMFGAARVWTWVAGVLLGLVTLCFLAGLLCWVWFDWGPGKSF